MPEKKPGTPTEPEQKAAASARPATAAELRGLGAGSDFALAALEAGLTLAQATPMAEVCKAGAAKARTADTSVVGAGTPLGVAPGGRGMAGAAGKNPGEDYDTSADVRAACAKVGMTRSTFVSWAETCIRGGDDYLAELRDWARKGID